jgi:hypothetical protein
MAQLQSLAQRQGRPGEDALNRYPESPSGFVVQQEFTKNPFDKGDVIKLEVF